MKKINIFSIIITLASSTNFSFGMEINLIEQEKNFQFNLVLNNITSPYIGEKNQALEMLSFLASTGYSPAISYIEQNNIFNQQTTPINIVTQPSPPNNDGHSIIAELIGNILKNKIPEMNPHHLPKIKQEAEKGNLKAAYCLQEMGFELPDTLRILKKLD